MKNIMFKFVVRISWSILLMLYITIACSKDEGIDQPVNIISWIKPVQFQNETWFEMEELHFYT